MPLTTAIPFYLATAAYVCAALLSVRFLKNRDDLLLKRAKRVAAWGNVLLLVVFVHRLVEYKLLPFTGMGDALNLLLILCTGIILTVQLDEKMRPLLSFYLPGTAILAIVNAAFAHRYLGSAPVALKGIPLTVHVGLAFLAFALFFVSSITSMAYAIQARQLKRHAATDAILFLPSLERLDRVLFRLIYIGYVLFLITLSFGFVWARVDPELLGPRWYLAPKILFSIATVIFYTVVLVIRRAGVLRGPKMANVLFVGFMLLLVGLLGLQLLDLSPHTFLSTTP